MRKYAGFVRGLPGKYPVVVAPNAEVARRMLARKLRVRQREIRVKMLGV